MFGTVRKPVVDLYSSLTGTKSHLEFNAVLPNCLKLVIDLDFSESNNASALVNSL